MRRHIPITLALLLLPALALAATANVIDSVALLYSQDETGGMEMRCTATAYAVTGDTYKFLTAAHCVTKDSATPGGLEVVREPLFLSLDDATGEKVFSRATVEKVGREEEGFDFALLSAKMSQKIPVTPLGNEAKEKDGVQILNVAAPLGLGRVVFHGYVSLRRIDRPLFSENQHINWQGAMLVQLPAEGGSSGSAIVSDDTSTVIAILVGTVGDLTVAIPISRVNGAQSKNLLYPAQPPAKPTPPPA